MFRSVSRIERFNLGFQKIKRQGKGERDDNLQIKIVDLIYRIKESV